jgi:hypothetical protein
LKQTGAKARLTARIWADLPVVLKWSTTRKNGNHGGEKGSDNQRETDPNWNAISLTKTILWYPVSD